MITAYLFLFLGLSAVAHYLVQSTLIPSFRKEVSFRLFALRDQLVHEMCRCSDETQLKEIELVFGHINTLISRMDVFTPVALFRTKQTIAENPKLMTLIEARKKQLTNSQNAVVRQTAEKMFEQAQWLLFVNSLGLVIYVVPIALIFIYYEKALKWIRAIALLPESESRHSMPPNGEHFAFQ